MLVHIVKPGEYLWAIVNYYGLQPSDKAVQKIYYFNGLWDTPYLVSGQHLLIPLFGLHYKVKAGETLWSIAKKFNFTISQLTAYNNIQDSGRIYPGMNIRFPDNTESRVKNPGDFKICIDPGHQAVPNLDREPIGPGSDIMKLKVDYGTRGIVTGKPEFELNLEVAMKVRELLEAKGYKVLMTRMTNQVNISNKERALMANDANAALCVRIHAYGSNTSSAENGLFVMHPSQNSPYTDAEKYRRSLLLAEQLLRSLIGATKAKSLGLSPQAELTGFNWSKIPVALVEMGYMTNPQEDIKLSTPEYQYRIAQGIVNGIEGYLIT